MNHAGPYSLGDLGYAKDRGAIVVKLDDIPVFDTPCRGIDRVEPNDLPGVSTLHHPMTGNLGQPGHVIVMLRVEGEPGMRRDELKRVLLRQFGGVSFPARDVMWQWGPLVIVGRILQQALGDEFY